MMNYMCTFAVKNFKYADKVPKYHYAGSQKGVAFIELRHFWLLAVNIIMIMRVEVLHHAPSCG